jgi:hypothetical protein
MLQFSVQSAARTVWNDEGQMQKEAVTRRIQTFHDVNAFAERLD